MRSAHSAPERAGGPGKKCAVLRWMLIDLHRHVEGLLNLVHRSVDGDHQAIVGICDRESVRFGEVHHRLVIGCRRPKLRRELCDAQKMVILRAGRTYSWRNRLASCPWFVMVARLKNRSAAMAAIHRPVSLGHVQRQPLNPSSGSAVAVGPTRANVQKQQGKESKSLASSPELHGHPIALQSH